MSKISEKLKAYQIQMSIYTERYRLIAASDVLDMIEQLQDDLKDTIDDIVEKLEKLKVDTDTLESKHHNTTIDICIDTVKEGGTDGSI